MDYTYLISICSIGLASTGIAYCASSLHKNLKLHRDLKTRDNETNLRILSLPKALNPIERSSALSLLNPKDELIQVIEEFCHTLENIEHIDLTNLYNNLNPMTIKKNDESGQFDYDVRYKIIKIGADNPREDLIKGLFYLASSDRFYLDYAAGFARNTEEYEIGYGLTRGYIELLSARYFNIDTTQETSILKDFAHLIEMLIGKEFMETAFFKGALDKVLETLGYYIPYSSAVKIVREMDHIETALRARSNVQFFLSSSTFRDLIQNIVELTVQKVKKEKEQSDLETILETLDKTYPLGIFSFSCPRKEKDKILNLLKHG